MTEKVAMTEMVKAHQNLLVKVHLEKRADFLVPTSRKDVAKVEIHVITACSRMFNICRFGEVCIQTHSKTCLMKEKISIDCCSSSIE